VREKRPCHAHHTEDVDVEEALGLRERVFLVGARGADARVADQDVDPPEPLDRGSDRIVAAHVRWFGPIANGVLSWRISSPAKGSVPRSRCARTRPTAPRHRTGWTPPGAESGSKVSLRIPYGIGVLKPIWQGGLMSKWRVF
jgi:hypothetical protein